MASFKSTNGDYKFHIAGSGTPFTDPNTGHEGAVQLDVYATGQAAGRPRSIFTNVLLEDVLDALNQIPGVKATYEEPKPPHIPVPQGIGAVVSLGGSPNIRLTRVNTGPGRNWVQNLRGHDHDGWYTDAQVEGYLNEFDYEVISEGV